MNRIGFSILLLTLFGALASANTLDWVSSDVQSFDCGETITIAANPEDGYTFSQWDDGNTDNPRTVLVGQEATFIAEFVVSSITAVDNVDEQKSAPRKMLINDKLYILMDDKLYDATGKRVR